MNVYADAAKNAGYITTDLAYLQRSANYLRPKDKLQP